MLSFFRIEGPPSPCEEKFEMEHSEKSLKTKPANPAAVKTAIRAQETPALDLTTSAGTRENVKSSPSAGRGGSEEGDVKASLMDSLAQLDPKALLLIQVGLLRYNRITFRSRFRGHWMLL